MSSTHITIAGSNPAPELSSDSQHSTVDHVSSQSQIPREAPSHSRREDTQGITQNSGLEGDINSVSELELTDVQAVELAQERFGQRFTPKAARAFLTYREDSDDVQACEFYRFSDEHFNKWGYF